MLNKKQMYWILAPLMPLIWGGLVTLMCGVRKGVITVLVFVGILLGMELVPRLYEIYFRWSLKRRLNRMTDEEKESFFDETNKELQKLTQEWEKEREKQKRQAMIPWYLKTLDVVLACLFLMGALWVVETIHNRSFFSKAIPVNYEHIIALLVGAGAYLFLRYLVLRAWK